MADKKNETKLKEKKAEVDDSKKKTPYQGKRRCFGFFKCTNCQRQWASAGSWANTWQKCFSCEAAVYPHHQRKLLKKKKSDGEPEKKAHLKKLCEKCRAIGFCCVRIRNTRKEESTDD